MHIVKEIVSDPKTKWIIRLYGEYDLAVAVWTRTVTEMKDFSDYLTEKYGQYIGEKKESIAVAVCLDSCETNSSSVVRMHAIVVIEEHMYHLVSAREIDEV